MSGHSKWSTIKHAKGITDAKRGAVFTKLSNAITIAVREGGGGDVEFNFRLRLAVEKAKEANMPKENISRSIDRGLGKGDEVILENAVYEGFAPHGVAVMVETISDNNTRTSNHLRSEFSKLGGSLGSIGSVGYLFRHLGEIETDPGSAGAREDGLFEKAIEVGAEDVEDDIVYTKPEDLHRIKENLAKSLKVVEASLVYRPNRETMVHLEDEKQQEEVLEFLSAIEELDDVQNIFTNLSL